MDSLLCDWACAVCGEVQKHPSRCILVQCVCGAKCLRLLPGGPNGPRSLRRSFPVSAHPSVGNGAGVAGTGQLSFGWAR